MHNIALSLCSFSASTAHIFTQAIKFIAIAVTLLFISPVNRCSCKHFTFKYSYRVRYFEIQIQIDRAVK